MTPFGFSVAEITLEVLNRNTIDRTTDYAINILHEQNVLNMDGPIEKYNLLNNYDLA